MCNVGADGHGGVPAKRIRTLLAAEEQVLAGCSGHCRPGQRAACTPPLTTSRRRGTARAQTRHSACSTAQHSTAPRSAAQRTSRARPASAAHPWGCRPARGLHQGVANCDHDQIRYATREGLCVAYVGCPPSMELAKGAEFCCPLLVDVCSTAHILVQHQHCKRTGAAGACKVEGLLDHNHCNQCP